MIPYYKISKDAEEDWFNIVSYTLKRFGKRQVQKYTNSLVDCLNDLAKEQGKVKEINISEHLVLIKHCQKHYIFALNQLNQPLLIIAILHEQMDLLKRLKNRLSD